MKDFNPYILLVMRWLLSKDSVSKEELEENYFGAGRAAFNLYPRLTARITMSIVTDASNAASLPYIYNDAEIKNLLNEYFELTGEDRKEYEIRAKHLNILGVNSD